MITDKCILACCMVLAMSIVALGILSTKTHISENEGEGTTCCFDENQLNCYFFIVVSMLFVVCVIYMFAWILTCFGIHI